MISDEQQVALAGWINQAQAEVAADREAEAEAQKTRDAALVVEKTAAWVEFYDQVEALLPEEIRPFVVREMLKVGEITPQTAAPFCRPGYEVAIDLGRKPRPFLYVEIEMHGSAGVKLDRDCPFKVCDVEEKLFLNEDGEYDITVWDSARYTHHFNEIGPAVVTALEMYDLYDRLVIEREKKNAELKGRTAKSKAELATATPSWEVTKLEDLADFLDVYGEMPGNPYRDAIVGCLGIIAEAMVKIATAD